MFVTRIHSLALVLCVDNRSEWVLTLFSYKVSLKYIFLCSVEDGHIGLHNKRMSKLLQNLHFLEGYTLKLEVSFIIGF